MSLTATKIDSQKRLKSLKEDDLVLFSRFGPDLSEHYDSMIAYLDNISTNKTNQQIYLKDIVSWPFAIELNNQTNLEKLVEFYDTCRIIQGSDFIKDFKGIYYDDSFNYILTVKQDKEYEFMGDLYLIK